MFLFVATFDPAAVNSSSTSSNRSDPFHFDPILVAMLEQQSPELLGMVMGTASSPRDLHNLISASPLCLAVFRENRKAVLCSLLRKLAPPPVMHHLVAVLRAPGFPNQHYNLPEDERRQVVVEFLDEYFAGTCFEMPTNEDDMLKLYQIYNRVSFMVSKLSSNMYRNILMWDELYIAKLRAAQNGSEPAGPKRYGIAQLRLLHPLSNTESSRLKRAMLRFEIYCRVFSQVIDDLPYRHHSHFPPYQQLEIFLHRLKRWEIEEMASIHQYYMVIVEDTLEKIGDDLFEAIRTAPESVRAEDPTETPPTMWAAHRLSIDGLTLWADCESLNRETIRSIASLGICFMKELVQADGFRPEELVLSNAVLGGDSLPDALCLQREPRAVSKRPGDITTNDPSNASFGYWAFGDQKQKTYFSPDDCVFESWALREIGYMFWDSNRFADPNWYGVFSQAAKIDLGLAEDYLLWPRGPSVEERLHGIYLPDEEWYRVTKKFQYGLYPTKFPYKYDFPWNSSWASS
jgi:hypothetical protein